MGELEKRTDQEEAIQRQIEEIQRRAKEIHKEEYMESHETGEDFDEVWDREYNKSDKFNEYIVNGALLTCTQATLEPFIIPDDDPIELHRDPNESEFEFKYGFGRKQTRLNVGENQLYLGKASYATVKDTVKDVNITPFRCNCAQMISSLSEIKYIRDHLEDCKKNGVCKYLMRLNEEWDNMPLENTENAITPSSYLSISDVEEYSVCYFEGITRTSVLVCKRGGGLIIPLTTGQETDDSDEIQDYIKNVLEALGWLIEVDELKKLKTILDDFGITDKNSIACFLLICVSESGQVGIYSGKTDRNGEECTDEYGRGVVEYYPVGYEVKVTYAFEARGVGYIQVTGKSNQLDCLTYLSDNKYYSGGIDRNALGYVKELRNLPWEASAWFWAVRELSADENLNNYVVARCSDNQGKLSLGVVLAAESFVNGMVQGEYGRTLGNIARGQSDWNYINGKILVGENSYSSPHNWETFENNYKILEDRGLL